jgi:hypothetical protein
MKVYHIHAEWMRPEYKVSGVTVVSDRNTRQIGVAVCSKKDQYARKIGVKNAVNRVLSIDNNTVSIMINLPNKQLPNDSFVGEAIVDAINGLIGK